MAYSRWATDEEIKKDLVVADINSDIEESGIIMMKDDNNIYINTEGNTMVIGSSGSGKTQSILLPQLRLSIKANESFVVNDSQGELYSVLGGELKNRNYNTIVIDLENARVGNKFNPLSLPYQLYKNNNKDKAIDLLENIGHYICDNELYNSNSDPFWINSAISLFVGVSLYLFETNDKEITFVDIFKCVSEFNSVVDEVEKMDKTSAIYLNLASIALAPKETRGSIISVFNQNIKLFTTRESLSKLLSGTDFDISSIVKGKTAIFIRNNSSLVSRRLVPMIIDLCYNAAIINNNKKRLNILVDGFENLVSFNDFNNMLNISRSYNIRFTICIKSILDLRNVYGVEIAEVLKRDFINTIYLFANDMETLEEIANYCGKKDSKELLISIEELKVLDRFEAIVLIPRKYPIKVALTPDYEIEWHFSEDKTEISEIK